MAKTLSIRLFGTKERVDNMTRKPSFYLINSKNDFLCSHGKVLRFSEEKFAEDFLEGMLKNKTTGNGFETPAIKSLISFFGDGQEFLDNPKYSEII